MLKRSPGGGLPTERSFGLFFGFLFLATALWFFYVRQSPMWPAIAFASAALVFSMAAVFAPRRLAPLNRAWARLGELMARVVNPVVMTAMFLLVITPYALAMRLLRRDALRLRPDPVAGTYWIDRPANVPDAASLERQY